MVARAHLVHVVLGMELVGGDLLDELHGQLQLRLLHGGVAHRHFRERPHLVRVVEDLHDEAALDGPHQRQVLLAPRGPLRQRAAPGLAHRFREQPVRLLAALVGPEVVRALEVDRVHPRQRDELGDLDRLARLLRHGLDLVFGEDDVLVLGELVALHHLVPRDDLLVLGADVLLLEPGVTLAVKEVERHRRLRFAGGIEADGDGDEAERDRGGRERARDHDGLHHSMATQVHENQGIARRGGHHNALGPQHQAAQYLVGAGHARRMLAA